MSRNQCLHADNIVHLVQSELCSSKKVTSYFLEYPDTSVSFEVSEISFVKTETKENILVMPKMNLKKSKIK